MNRILVEAIRSMSADSKLPKRFWAEALSTTTYLNNRSPTNAVQDKTPYEAWTDNKPNVSHLCIFGCDAYADVPKDKRTKLDSKTRRRIFLAMDKEQKVTTCMINHRRGYFTARILSLMKQDQQSKMMTKML